MNKISIITFLMTLSCAGATQQQSLEDKYTDLEDNKCIRECAMSYWECESLSNVRIGRGVLSQQGFSEAIIDCRLSLNRCANSCPDK
jgi:hypothetical protein